MKRFAEGTVILTAGLILLFAGCSKSNEPRPEPLVNRIYLPDNLVIGAGGQLVIPVYFDNEVPISEVSLSLSYTGHHSRCDSVSFIDSRVSGFWMKSQYADTVNQKIHVLAVDTSSGVSRGSGVLVNLYFWTFGNAPESDVIIDTVTFFQPGPLAYADTALMMLPTPPQFKAGKFHIKSQL